MAESCPAKASEMRSIADFYKCRRDFFKISTYTRRVRSRSANKVKLIENSKYKRVGV